MRTDEKGLSATEGALLVIIVLLIISTGVLVFAIYEMGPDDKPNLVIEDVYFKKDNSTMKINPYVTNLGKPDAETKIEWTLTDGNRLITEGSESVTVDGRETYRGNFEIQDHESGKLKITVVYDGDVKDTYSKQL